jgi:hypothetical protein
MSLQTNGEPTSIPFLKAFELLGLEKAGKFLENLVKVARIKSVDLYGD